MIGISDSFMEHITVTSHTCYCNSLFTEPQRVEREAKLGLGGVPAATVRGPFGELGWSTVNTE